MDDSLQSHLRALRQRHGLQQRDLAARIGVSRQTLSSIEAGTTVPSTLIALALARVLQCRVEDLFALSGDARELEARLVGEVAGPSAHAAKKQDAARVRVALGQVGQQWVARSLEGESALMLGTPADGIATLARTSSGLVRVRVLRDLEALGRNLFVAGCDPGVGLLGRHLEERLQGPRLHWIELASQAALDELFAEHVHVAGLHFADIDEGNVNAAVVRRRFGDRPMVLVTLASWEMGLVYRPSRGKGPRTVAALARKGLRCIAREPGAGAQHLLESALTKAKLRPSDLDVVAVARSHRGVAQLVANGVGDVGVATLSAAAAVGLAYSPIAESRFDLAFPAELAADARMQALLECLASPRFRKDLGAMTGYHTSKTGNPVQPPPA